MIILQISVLVLLISILCTTYWLYHNRDEAVYRRIITQDGYSLSLVKEGITVNFFLKPEWIPKEVGETKLNLVIAKKFDSDIILDKVEKRDTDFYIQIKAVSHPSRSSGQLLSLSQLTNDTFSNLGNLKWTITDTNGKDILEGNYGTAEGSDLTLISINDTDRDKFSQGVKVSFSGFNLYGYRQYNKSYKGILPAIIVTALIIGSLVMLYRKRTDPENGLGWKLLGHMLLGGFTFAINNFKLPLGFVVYLLFFRKPRSNLSVKDKAALLGLLMYVLQLVVPPIVHYLDSEPQSLTIRHISAKELGADGLWKMVAARAAISIQARVDSFDAVLSANGEIKELSFRLTDMDAKGLYTHVWAVYQSSDQSVKLSRSTSEQWAQYSQLMSSDNFIEQFNRLQLLKLKPSGANHNYIKIELLNGGMQANYAMKDMNNYGVDEKGVYPIGDNQLPVTAHLMYVCAPQSLDNMSACEDDVNYYFNIVEGGARE